MAFRRREKRQVSLSAVCVVCWMTLTCPASDLSDSIQQFFQGDYAGARQLLSRSIDRGEADARVYYFRGLAQYRLGDLEAAEEDFQAGAQLEVAGRGHGVGQALQRIQGVERLQLEKHRRLAKLKARQRSQPVAPPPIQRRQVRLADVRGEVRDRTPIGNELGDVRRLRYGLRLASEVPLSGRRSPPDPFIDDPGEDFVGVRAPTVRSIEAQDQPVGTGVAKASNLEASPGGEDDLFGSLGPSTTVSRGSDPSGGEGSLRVFGAIVRALGKATIPQVDPRELVPDALRGDGRAAGTATVDDYDQNPFGQDNTFGDSPFGEESPFGDEADFPAPGESDLPPSGPNEENPFGDF